METSSTSAGGSTGRRHVTQENRADFTGSRPLAQGHSLEGRFLRVGPQLRHWRIWVALFRAVELRDSPQMNFGDTNFVIAVLLLFLFLGNELAIAQLAFDG